MSSIGVQPGSQRAASIQHLSRADSDARQRPTDIGLKHDSGHERSRESLCRRFRTRSHVVALGWATDGIVNPHGLPVSSLLKRLLPGLREAERLAAKW